MPTRKNLRSLSPYQVASLLREKRLGAFADGFFEQDYDGEVLAEICDDSDLEDFLSIAKPKRKKLLRLLAEWRERGVPPEAAAADAAALPPSGGDGRGGGAPSNQSTAADSTPEFERRMAQLRRGFDGSAAAERQTLLPLRAVLARIVDSPSKSKYRRVKVGPTWGIPICAVLGAEDSVALLRAVGFGVQTVDGGALLALEDGAAALAPLHGAIAALDRRLSELSAYVADISSPFSVTVDDVRPSASGAATLWEAAASAAAAQPPRFIVPLRYAAVTEQLSASAQPLAGGMGAEERAAVLRDPRIAAAVREQLKSGAGATQSFAFRLSATERAARDAERRKKDALSRSFRLRVDFTHDALSLSAQFHPAETLGAVRGYLDALLEGGASAGRAFDLRPALALEQPAPSATLLECGVAPSGRLCLRWTEEAALSTTGVAVFAASLRARVEALEEVELEVEPEVQ